MTRFALAALAAVALAPPAAAEDPSEASRNAAAWRAAQALQGDMLPGALHAEFMLLAWHAAAANLCAPLMLDHEKFGAAYATLEHSDAASLSEAEHAYFRHHLAVNFGVAVGIMLAQHSRTPEEVAEFCAAAEAFARDPEEANVFDADALGPAE